LFRVIYYGFAEAAQKLRSFGSALKETVLDSMERAANQILVPEIERRAPPYANLDVQRGPEYVVVAHLVTGRKRPWRGTSILRRSTYRESSRRGTLYGKRVKPTPLYSIFEEVALEAKEEIRDLIVRGINQLLERI